MGRIKIKKIALLGFAFLGVIFLAAANPFPARSQSLLNTADFFIKTSPESPGPGTEVAAEVVSFNIDLDRAYITWVLNDKTTLKGKGEKTLKFSLGSAGKSATLKAIVSTEDGTQLQKTLTFSNAEVDLLWEAQTLTPVWYQGKALPTPGSKIRISAFPRLFNTSPENLIYQWKKNYEPVVSSSGLGKRFIEFTLPMDDPYARDKIEVEVSNLTKTISAKKSIQIEARDFKLLFYENNPLEGIRFQEALNNLTLKQDNIEIKAEPYFFAAEDKNELSYEWTINQENIAPQITGSVFSLNIAPGITGSFSLEANIKNPKKIIQFIQKSLAVTKE